MTYHRCQEEHLFLYLFQEGHDGFRSNREIAGGHCKKQSDMNHSYLVPTVFQVLHGALYLSQQPREVGVIDFILELRKLEFQGAK